MPFLNIFERDLHFTKHGHKFGAPDALEYEKLADAFLYGQMAASTHECVRPSGIDRVRFDDGTHHEGVACIMPEYVRTFYPVKATLIARHGGEAGYFAHECGRVQL
jgi:hypothetical protein